MTRSGWHAGIAFAAGLFVGAGSAVILLLHVHHIVLRDFHSTVPSWVSLLLGSSVVATVAAALLNVHAVKLTRANSFSDRAFVAYLHFNQEARQYLADMERFTAGRLSTKRLRAKYEDVHAHLGRIRGGSREQVRLLESVYYLLAEWPTGEVGKPGASAAHATAARDQLDALESSMRDLGRPRLRHSSTAAGKAA